MKANATILARLNDSAYVGNRVIAYMQDGKKKTLCTGLGNRAGLHDYAYTLIEEQYEKYEKRITKLDFSKVKSIEVFYYRAKDRMSSKTGTLKRYSIVLSPFRSIRIAHDGVHHKNHGP